MDFLKQASEAFRLDRFEDARQLYLAVLEQVGDIPSEEQVAAHRGLALISNISEHHEDAYKHLERALSGARELARSELVVELRETLGYLLYSEGRFSEAESVFDDALSLAMVHGYLDLVPALLGHLGNVRFHQQDLEGARSRYHDALDLLGGTDIGEQAILENGLGECSAEESDWAKALEHYQRSLELVGQLDEPLRVAISHRNIGEVLIELGRLEEAASHLMLSITEGLKVEESDFFISPATALAIAWMSLGKHEESVELVSLLLAIDPDFLSELTPLSEKRKGSLLVLPTESGHLDPNPREAIRAWFSSGPS